MEIRVRFWGAEGGREGGDGEEGEGGGGEGGLRDVVVGRVVVVVVVEKAWWLWPLVRETKPKGGNWEGGRHEHDARGEERGAGKANQECMRRREVFFPSL